MDANLGLPVLGARVNRLQYGHYFSDEGLVRGRRFWLLFSPVRKVTRTLTLYKLRSNERIRVRKNMYLNAPVVLLE